MTDVRPVLGVVGSAADGVELLRERLVEPMLDAGWRVAVTLTPIAATWLRALGEVAKLEAVTGLPVRDQPRLPSEERPHPPADCYVVARHGEHRREVGPWRGGQPGVDAGM